jgi:hypothetical protein
MAVRRRAGDGCGVHTLRGHGSAAVDTVEGHEMTGERMTATDVLAYQEALSQRLLDYWLSLTPEDRVYALAALQMMIDKQWASDDARFKAMHGDLK